MAAIAATIRLPDLPNRPALLGALAVDRAFDLEQGVDAANRLQCQWRDRAGGFALRLAAGIGSDISQDEKRPASMDPAPRLHQWARLAIGLVQLGVTAIGIGLKDPGILLQMCLRVLARPIARVVEHRRRWRRPAKRTVVAHVNPTSPSVGLALSQDRYGGVVAVHSLGLEDVAFDSPDQRCQHCAAAAYLIG